MSLQHRRIEVTFVEVYSCDLLVAHSAEPHLPLLEGSIRHLVLPSGRHSHELHPLLKGNQLEYPAMLEAHVLLIECRCPFLAILPQHRVSEVLGRLGRVDRIGEASDPGLDPAVQGAHCHSGLLMLCGRRQQIPEKCVLINLQVCIRVVRGLQDQVAL